MRNNAKVMKTKSPINFAIVLVVEIVLLTVSIITPIQAGKVTPRDIVEISLWSIFVLVSAAVLIKNKLKNKK